MLTPTEWPLSCHKWILAIIFVSALHFQGIAQDPAAEQKSIEKSAFWDNAYKAAEAYFSNPSPKNAEMFAKALPEKRDNWPSDGELRLANLVFDFDGIGMRKNFSILEKDIDRGEPHAVDVGFRVAWWEQQEDEAGYPDLLEKRLNARIEAIQSVNDKGLRELRDRCLKILEDSRSPKRNIGGNIDKTIIREIDLTWDGKPEKIVLHVTGKDIHSPFTWTIEINSGGRRIYFEKEVGTAEYDTLFNSPDVLRYCPSYESCKKQWYFDGILNSFLIKLTLHHSVLLQNKGSGPWLSYDEITDLILKTGKATLEEAKRITGDLKRRIENGKAYGIDLDFGYFTRGPIAIWIPLVEDFVEVFGVS